MPYDDTTEEGGFGALLGDGSADNLIHAVRHSRAARIADRLGSAGAAVMGEGSHVPSERMPTFGELGEEQRMAQAATPAPQPQASPEDIMGQLAFVVDVRSGHLKPILPGEPEASPGPTEIVLKMQPDGQPNIVAQGKRVRPQDIARLQDPKRGVKPQLAPDYQVPPQYEGLAEALGIKQGEGQGPGAETPTASPQPETTQPDEQGVGGKIARLGARLIREGR